jgi:beta-fructofuranosidase
MGLKLDDDWIWDVWLAVDGEDYHAYYLRAPRSLGDPELRHRQVSIGHAVSRDLREWEVLPDALQPARIEGVWDDYTTWTGSVIKHEGLWYMLYTGGNRAENALVQRIGLAQSRDLIHWERYSENPVIHHDAAMYELYEPGIWHDHTWRDPWVLKDSQSEVFYAFITARLNEGPNDGRGVVALARSMDLFEWQVLKPVTPSGEFGFMEVPQVVRIESRYYLLFSTVARFHSKARRARVASPPETGIHYLVAENLTGPYHYLTDDFLLGDAVGRYYGAKLIKDPQGGWVLLPMLYLDESESFIGAMGDPVHVRVDSRGLLVVEDSPL